MSRVRLLFAAFVAAKMTVVALVVKSLLAVRAPLEDVMPGTISMRLSRFRFAVVLVMRRSRILAVVLCGALVGVALLWPTPSTAAAHERHRSGSTFARITHRARRTGDCNDNGEIIAPCTSTKSIKVGGALSVGYTFTNNNLEPIFIAPSMTNPSWMGCSSSPTSVTVPSHQARTFTVTCDGGADGTAVVQVTADGVFAEINVTVSSLSITPDG
ncbi:MAG TPA: hypothetical protein VIJ11_10735, partial [Galbitalea sp.]